MVFCCSFALTKSEDLVPGLPKSIAARVHVCADCAVPISLAALQARRKKEQLDGPPPLDVYIAFQT